MTGKLQHYWRWFAAVLLVLPALFVDVLIAVQGWAQGADSRVAWIDRLPTLLRPSPSNNFIAALAIVLTVAALVVAVPRGSRDRRAWFTVLIVCTLGWGGSYYISRLHVLGPDGPGYWYSFASLLTWTLGLFWGFVEPTAEQPFPLSFQLARLFGLLTLFSVVASLLMGMLRRGLDRQVVRHLHDIDVVIGVDANALELVKRLQHERDREARGWWRPHGAARSVVVAHSESSDPALEQFARLGCRVTIGDLESPDFCRSLVLTHGLASVRRFFAVTPQEILNQRLVENAIGSIDKKGASSTGEVPRLIARFDDHRRAREWRLKQLSSPHCFVDAITHEESTARALVARMISDGTERLIVLGDSALTLALLHELVMQRAFRAEIAEETGAGSEDRIPPQVVVGEVIICCPEAAHTVDEWDMVRTAASEYPAPLQVTAVNETWESVVRSSADGAATTVIAVGAASKELDNQSQRLATLVRDHNFYAPAPDAVQFHEGYGVVRYSLGFLHGDGVPEDSWTSLARQTHEVYLAGKPATKSPARRHWDPWQPGDERLSHFYREDTLRQQRTLMTNVQRMFGAQDREHPQRQVWSHVSAHDAVPPDLSPSAIELLARKEHERWCEMRLGDSWKTGFDPDPQQAERARLNPNLVSWDDGSPLEPAAGLAGTAVDIADLHAWNIRTIEHLLKRMKLVGIAPVPARYERAAKVLAEQLDGPRSWRTTEGDQLSVGAGDWWVTDLDGANGHGVAADRFIQSHVPTGADHEYGRRGTVTAFQTDARLAVTTLEGPAMAAVGDWIVTDENDDSWPVPDAEFRRKYRLSGA